MSVEYRTVKSVTHHPEGRCPKCGEQPHHFPKGLEADGVTVYHSCVNCGYAAKAEQERRARR